MVLFLAPSLLASCGWDEPTGCDYWVHKLEAGEQTQVALQKVVEGGCAKARPLLGGLVDDPSVGGDALETLVALGRSPEAEQAVRGALGDPRTVALAAEQVAAWKLDAADEVRAALADDALAPHREALLEAALAVAPAERWVGSLLDLAGGGDDALAQRALEALATVDWTEARGAEARAVEVLAARAVDPGSREAALAALGRMPGDVEAPEAGPLVEAARAGDRAALLVLAGLDPAAVRRAAVHALVAEGTPAEARQDAAPLAAGGDREAVLEALEASEDAPHRLWSLALVLGDEATPALERAAEEGSGDLRAEAVRALALTLPKEGLSAWREAAERHASALVREVVGRPDVRAAAGLTSQCGADAGCYVEALEETLPELATLDERLAAARKTLAAAREVAEEAVAADRDRAGELAEAEDADADAARAELDALKARRDEAYRDVRRLGRRVDELEAIVFRASLALRRLLASPGDDAGAATEAALGVLRQAGGEAAGPVRLWAWRVLVTRAGSGHVADLEEVADALEDDPALAFAVGRLLGRLRAGD